MCWREECEKKSTSCRWMWKVKEFQISRGNKNVFNIIKSGRRRRRRRQRCELQHSNGDGYFYPSPLSPYMPSCIPNSFIPVVFASHPVRIVCEYTMGFYVGVKPAAWLLWGIFLSLVIYRRRYVHPYGANWEDDRMRYTRLRRMALVTFRPYYSQRS